MPLSMQAALDMTHPHETGRLLVVDDDSINRDSLAQRLSKRGFETDTAADGLAALDKILRTDYDLVVLDQMMPGMSGLDLLRIVRATFSPAKLPVIMVTALDQDEMIVEALDRGANDYLVKPVEMPEILSRIRTQLYRSRSSQAAGLGKDRTAAQGRSSVHNDQGGSWLWDPNSNAVQFSPAWKQILGYRVHELADNLDSWLDRIHPADLVRVRKQLKAHLEGPAAEFYSEHRVKHQDGTYRWVLCRGVGVRTPDGKLLRMAGSMVDIHHAKTTDPLTGLSNRSKLLDEIDAARKSAPGSTLALMLIDLDEFKQINNNLGHAAGDHLIIAIAARLKEVLEQVESADFATVSRIGGDEFVIALSGPAIGEPEVLADHVRRKVAEPVDIEGHSVAVSCSIGTVMMTEARPAEQFLLDAQLAITEAKLAGKNRNVRFDPSLRARSDNRMRIAADLRRAAERGELRAVYQPKVDLNSRRILGFEALLRWEHPELGMLPPSEFIPIAEETGMIVPAGEWILREACNQLKTWQDQYPQEPPLSMSVNLSVKQLLDPQLVAKVRDILDETQIPPATLTLELTETFLVTEKEAAREILSEIHALCVGLELDDFGTGYAGLNYLNSFPFDALKIDRSFVMRLGEDADSRAIIRTIIALANELGMGLIAEGVETEKQIGALLELGCGSGQGFYFSRPVAPYLADQLLERNRHRMDQAHSDSDALHPLVAGIVGKQRDADRKHEDSPQGKPQPFIV